MAILVTGATGFIGTHLVETLIQSGDHVRCLVRPTSKSEGLRARGVELAIGAINDSSALKAAVRDVDVVYHLAGRTSAFREADLYRVNRDGTHQLALACARRTSPPKLIFVSSIAASGPTRFGQVRLETDKPAPVSLYGASKRAGELAAEGFAHAVPTTIIRPGMVFGPRDRELLPVFRGIQSLRIHVTPTFDPPPLSMIHVADLVDLLMRAGRSDRHIVSPSAACGQGYYFACAPEYPNYAEFGRMIAEALGIRRVFLWPFVEPVGWLIAAVHETANRVIGRLDTFNIDKMREVTAGPWICSTQAAERDFGFEVQRPLIERLRETAQWYRENGWLTGGFKRRPELVSPTTQPRQLDVA